MNWNSWGEFWAMGGYGFYVWGSYGLCAVVFVLESLSARRRLKRALSQIHDAG